MRRDVLFDKYKNILIDIITNYNNTKTKKRGPKFKCNNLFYLKKILHVLLYNHVWESLDTNNMCDISTIRKKFYKWSDLGFFQLCI